MQHEVLFLRFGSVTSGRRRRPPISGCRNGTGLQLRDGSFTHQGTQHDDGLTLSLDSAVKRLNSSAGKGILMHYFGLPIAAVSDLANLAGQNAFAFRSSTTKAKTTTKTV